MHKKCILIQCLPPFALRMLHDNIKEKTSELSKDIKFALLDQNLQCLHEGTGSAVAQW